MKFEQLSANAPELGRAYGEMVSKVNSWLAAAKLEVAKTTDDVDLFALFLWLRQQRIERKQESAVRWQVVTGLSQEDGSGDYVVFVSDSGDMARLPADFLQAFESGKTLKLDIRPLTENPSLLCLSRAGHSDCRFPLSLLRHLMVLREERKSLTDTTSAGIAKAQS